MISSLVITIGNTLRGGDAAAHRVLKSIPESAHIHKRSVTQLTPEIAAEIANYATVVFVDADVRALDIEIAPVVDELAPSLLTHVLRPSEVVGLARILFGFHGKAYLCRIPLIDLSAGLRVSPEAQQLAQRAAEEIDSLIESTIKWVRESRSHHPVGNVRRRLGRNR